MLPSVVSRQVADSVAAFLRAAFPLNSPLFNGENNDNVSMLEQFLAQPETLLKGPYLSAQLPFRKSDLPLNFFPNLTLPFPAARASGPGISASGKRRATADAGRYRYRLR